MDSWSTALTMSKGMQYSKYMKQSETAENAGKQRDGRVWEDGKVEMNS